MLSKILEQPELWGAGDEAINWYHHFGKLLKLNTNVAYDQQVHSQVYTQEKCVPMVPKDRYKKVYTNI